MIQKLLTLSFGFSKKAIPGSFFRKDFSEASSGISLPGRTWLSASRPGRFAPGRTWLGASSARRTRLEGYGEPISRQIHSREEPGWELRALEKPGWMFAAGPFSDRLTFAKNLIGSFAQCKNLVRMLRKIHVLVRMRESYLAH